MRSTAQYWIRSLACLAVLGASPAFAQSTDTPVELQETDIFGTGARAMGMGKAYLAISEDISALGHNPAGLAQIRRLELALGLAHDKSEWEVGHTSLDVSDRSNTRFEHVAFAYPVPTYRGSLVLGIGFRRWADLETNLLKQGFLDEPAVGVRGLYEFEEFSRKGVINAWTGAIGYDLSPSLSVGASVSYLRGKSQEDLFLANYRATLNGNVVELDLGSPSDPDDRLFEEIIDRHATVDGYTGSVGVLGYLAGGFRAGAVLDFPTKLNYDGRELFRFEDWEKVDSNFDPSIPPIFFEDDITLPLSLSGGLSWGRQGLLLAVGARWTDYAQIDFEGDILAPSDPVTGRRESAYRSVVAVNLGAEYQLSSAPVRFRAGFFTEPLPYKLVAADPDFVFVPDDNDPDTFDDTSIIYRDYPKADIVSDQKFLAVGAGIVVQDAMTLDLAFLHGWWERATPGSYENSTDFFPTLPTTEKVTQNRFFLSTTIHLE